MRKDNVLENVKMSFGEYGSVMTNLKIISVQNSIAKNRMKKQISASLVCFSIKVTIINITIDECYRQINY